MVSKGNIKLLKIFLKEKTTEYSELFIWKTAFETLVICEVERVFWEEILLYARLDEKKKNHLRVTIARLHEAYCFCCVLTMSIYWHAIAYASVWACVITNYKILPWDPLTNILFLCDTNTNYVITYATENIRTNILKPTESMVYNERFCS